ncbi:hypothetical protein [Calidifontibacter indicus]|uniref:hypothetical protein n=1 Tax=Calidifontibacter indicus TaxID=419650 RepID=UPI003D706F1F
MSTDFETLLRTTEPKIRPIDPGVVIARTDRRRRRRAYAIGAGVAAGVLAASSIGWGAYGRLAGPTPAGPQPVTADCVVSQRHSMPAGRALRDMVDQPTTTALGPGAPNTTIRVTPSPDGTFGLASAPDGTSFKDLDQVGGGRCGLTIFADGKYRYLVAPVSPDTEQMTMSGGVMMTAPLMASDGTLYLLGVSTHPNLDSHPIAYWMTTDGAVVDSDSDDIRTVRSDGVRISVNTTDKTFDVAGTDEWLGNRWEKLTTDRPTLVVTDTYSRAVVLLPSGSRDVSYRLFERTRQVYVGPLGPTQAAPPLVAIPGSDRSALIIRTGAGEAGTRAVAQVDWKTPDGRAHRWTSPSLS